MRRTKLQRQTHRRTIEEGLVTGLAPPQIVRTMVARFGLTLRQARHDLRQVQEAWRRQDDELRQNRWKLVDLAIASDRCDREFHAALDAGDARRAMRAERHRSKLLGIYHADRCRLMHMPRIERDAIQEEFARDLPRMYDQAPRNPDGSVVLTAYSLSPPTLYDEQYRLNIEQPLQRGLSPRRQARIDALRALLTAGQRMDQLEALAVAHYRLSSRQVRDDVRQLQWQLEFEGYAMHQGTHDVQHLPLALRRRERIAELARHGPPPPRDEAAEQSAAAEQPGVARSEHGCEGRGTEEHGAEEQGDGDGDGEARGSSDGTRGNGENREPPGDSTSRSVAAVSSAPKEPPRAKRTPVKVPDLRLLADVEIDRCRLLGLSARERPKPSDDTLRWVPHDWLYPERCRPTPRWGSSSRPRRRAIGRSGATRRRAATNRRARGVMTAAAVTTAAWRSGGLKLRPAIRRGFRSERTGTWTG